MFCPNYRHYSHYRGNTTEIAPITAVHYHGLTAVISTYF